MALFKSGNPTLSEKQFRSTVIEDITDQNAMTIKGTMQKFGFLFLMTLGTAYYAWTRYLAGVDVWPLVLWGVFGGLAVALIITFKKEWSPDLAPA